MLLIMKFYPKKSSPKQYKPKRSRTKLTLSYVCTYLLIPHMFLAIISHPEAAIS